MRFILSLLALVVFAACAPQQPPPSQDDQFQATLQDAINRTREQREAYIDAHPNLSPEFREAILQGQTLPGMTKDDVMGIEGGKPPADCPSSTSVDGDVWVYCVHSARIGPLVTPEVSKTIVFDKSGQVVSVTKSGSGPIRNVFGTPVN